MKWPEEQVFLAVPQLLPHYVNQTRILAADRQIESAINTSPPVTTFKHSLACRSVWDAKNARFDNCFLPIISVLPGAVALLVLLHRVLQPLLRKRPQWLKPFVVEDIDDSDLIQLEKRKPFSWKTRLLILTTIIGLVTDLVALAWPRPNFAALLPAISWLAKVKKATALLFLIIDRPRSTPKGVLLILLSTAAVQLTLQLNHESNLNVQDIPGVVAIFASFAALAIILCTPFRNPDLPHDDISPPSDKPTNDLRSPEDRLTPWQFATVTWMNPLINIGTERQINNEDVWKLSYQFQHKALHERFRELPGSVLRRLLKANAIDLIIICTLGFVEIACSKFKIVYAGSAADSR
ncbi:uncharacterized protein KY384_009257 [Bacidia gigantensis]|uniref:uncharacterized protein n=1 Tax=Bacidia gigantensis TaxID=2732470 RepID=UPI001D055308|nr:uncharacterized protein KY384_009257 [Bacidia gigantensis]KAG8525613.1 hypothetical protein KY384_009257 [Bacidia gigantensis]